MKSLVELLESLLQDCGSKCAVDSTRDVQTLRRRVEHEGDSFITITLPSFSKEFERALEEGGMAPGSFSSFGKKRSGVPTWMSGFMCHVFDSDSSLVEFPRVDCIRAIRQVCLFGKKLLRPCSKEREEEAIRGYLDCEDGFAMSANGSQMERYFEIVAAILLSRCDLGKEQLAALTCCHGPGATVERLTGANQKWRFDRWHARLEDVGIAYDVFGRGSNTATRDDMASWPELVEPEDEEPVRVVLVPKTLKTPRIIAVEPVCMQYAQQGLKRLLVEQLENCSYTAGHVNFRDQKCNQVLAQSSSSDGRLATLDMAEASDRVSVAHVSALLSSVPFFRDWVFACRSTRARLPDGNVIPLKKFASMGSAMTFPIEALVFYTSIIASRLRLSGQFPTPRTVHEQSRDVYVYGDDLIVPAGQAAQICEDLETFGFRVNRQKSFWTGKFRESCGVDCYDGSEVTPVYLRRDLPADRSDVSGILSTVATANQLSQAGYPLTAYALQESVETVLGEKLPQVSVDGPAIGWHFYSEVVPRERVNRAYQRKEFLCWVPYSPSEVDPLDGDPALAKCLRMIQGGLTLPLGGIEPPDPEHLERSVTSYAVALKRRWVLDP